MSGQVAGLCQDTSSLRALKRIGVAVTRSGGSGLTVGWIRTIIVIVKGAPHLINTRSAFLVAVFTTLEMVFSSEPPSLQC